MNVIAVVAHPDDEVLAMGGTLARHVDNGDNVHVCILADGVSSRYEQRDEEITKKITQRRERARKACNILGVDSVSFHTFPDNQFDTVPLLQIVQTIEEEIDTHNPSTIYTQHYGDLNIDHEFTCRATMTATRPLKTSGVNRVLAGETLSSSEWSVPRPDNAFQPTTFVDVSEHMKKKTDALSVYKNELRDPPHPRTLKTVERNAKVWGAKVGISAAEPFQILREVRD